LSRNEEFRERAAAPQEISLAEILAGIDRYEHVFSENSVAEIASDLEDIVKNSLLVELGEQVVDAWPLPSAPDGTTHKGSFKNGALVLTNIRGLVPYTFTWQETHGNVRTTYTGAAMPVFPLPLLQRICVVAQKRVKRSIYVDFQYQEGIARIRPRKTNLAKLLLVARMWGVPMEARHEDARMAELRWALFRPWQWLAGLFVLATCLAGAVGLFEDGTTDSILDMFDFLHQEGLWQWSVVLTAALSGWRLWRWMFAYNAIDLSETLRSVTNPKTNVGALSKAAASG
jgi:hypothetical protein